MNNIKKVYINEIGNEEAVIYVMANEQRVENVWGTHQSLMQNEIGVKDTVENVMYSLKNEMNKVKEMMKCAYISLTNDIVEPDELEIEMGLELSSNVGIVLVSGDMSANIKVKAVWKKQ